MYKVIIISNDGYTAKMIDCDAKPDRDTVICFSGDDTDPVPHVYDNPDSEAARAKRKWAAQNEFQQKIFKAYYEEK